MKQTRKKCPTRIEFWIIHARVISALESFFWTSLDSQEQKARGRQKKGFILSTNSIDRIEFPENVAFLRRRISGCRFFQEMYLSAAA